MSQPKLDDGAWRIQASTEWRPEARPEAFGLRGMVASAHPVAAAIGLSIGLLNEPTYATIVVIAVTTTVMTAPLLNWCVGRAGPEATGLSATPARQSEIIA